MHSAADRDGTPVNPAPPTILVVEDSDDMSSLITSVLEDEGYVVRRATTGEEALRQARAACPDLITLDVALPDGSGIDVISALRADPITASVSVIAVSAYAGDSNGHLERLVTRVLPKPFYVSDLVDAVAEVLGSRVPPSA